MVKTKHILIISESIDIEDSSGSKGRVALIKQLIHLGYIVKVLHYTRKEIHIEGAQCIAIKEFKTTLNYFLSRLQRLYQRITKHNISKPLERIFGHSFTFFNDSKSISRSIKKYYEGESLILTLSKGASFRPHHALLSLPNLHSKWGAYVHDPYPFHLYPEPYNWKEAGHAYKERFFKKVSEKAAFSIFPSLLLLQWMGNYYPRFLETGKVIPHQTMKEVIDHVNNMGYFNEDGFSLLHAGNMLGYRNPFPLIEGFQKFLEENPEAKHESQLLLIGPSQYHEPALSDLCTTIPQIYLSAGYIPFAQVYTIQQKASVNIILESTAKHSPFLPGKFPHYVTADKPILLLSSEESESKRILGEDYPYALLASDTIKIAQCITQLYRLWKEDPTSLRLNRKDLITYFSSSYLQDKIEEIINEV